MKGSGWIPRFSFISAWGSPPAPTINPSRRTFGSALTQNLLMIFGDDETIKACAGMLMLFAKDGDDGGLRVVH